MTMTAGGFPMPVCLTDYVPRLAKENRLGAGKMGEWHIFREVGFSFAEGDGVRAVHSFRGCTQFRKLSLDWLQ
jgi:hypothetical protein